MEEDFDKRLSDHIKNVFDDTDGNDADAGWDLLREKYPPKNDRKPIAWFWWLAAAIIITGLGTGLWEIEKNDKDKTIKTIGRAHNDSAEERRLPRRVSNTRGNGGKTFAPLANKKSATTPVKKDQKDNAIASGQLHIQKPDLRQSYKNTQKQVKKIRKKSIVLLKAENASVKNHVAEAGKIKAPTTNNGVDNDVTSDLSVSVLQDGISKFLIDRVSLQPAKLSLKPLKPDTSVQKTSPVKSRQIVYGVFASAFYSTANGSDNEFNAGAGGTVDIKLGTHLGVASGLGVMRATLNYSILPGSNNYAAYSSASSVQVSLPPVLGFHNYTAKLLALDIPINLKYNFAKPYNFISAGLSSNVYISEYYDQVYAYFPSQSGLPDTHQVTEHHFGHADLFKTFNLSFGLGYPIGNKSALIFEPFLKAPLTGLGSQQLKYSLIGINLKLNFQTPSK